MRDTVLITVQFSSYHSALSPWDLHTLIFLPIWRMENSFGSTVSHNWVSLPWGKFLSMFSSDALSSSSLNGQTFNCDEPGLLLHQCYMNEVC